MSLTNYPYALIGAGPSGLATARVLQRRGIQFIGFESHAGVGGMWDLANENSVVYNSAHLISSKLRSQFAEFPMPQDWPEFLPHHLVKRYLNEYADHFDLRKYFRFNCKIKNATRYPQGGWELELTDGTRYQVAGIFVASGPHQKPIMPGFPGKFDGEVIHSKSYKDPEIFRNKRSLIVGLGNTACDISVDAIPFAAKVDISVRESNYFVPKLLMGRPADHLQSGLIPRKLTVAIDKLILKFVMGRVESYGLPKPKFNFLDKHPILNSLILHHLHHGDINIKREIERFDGKTVYFKNGEKEDYDLIIMATGYRPNFTFLDEQALNLKDGIPDFYLKIFHPTYNDLFIIGMIESTGFGWQGRHAQANLVVDYIECLRSQRRQKQLQAFDQQRQIPTPLNRTGDFSLFVDKQIYAAHFKRLGKLFAQAQTT